MGCTVERGLVQRVSGHFDENPKPGSTTPGAGQGNPVQASDRLLQELVKRFWPKSIFYLHGAEV